MPTALVNVHVLCTPNEAVRPDFAVILDDDGFIAELLPHSRVPSSFAGRVHDGRGATAIAGLIDMHTHAMGGTAEESLQGQNPATVTTQVLRGLANLSRAVEHGITTIRDAGAASTAIFRLKSAVDAGEVKGPRMILAGSALTMTGGHGSTSISVEADGVDGLRKAARNQIKAGAECIKLMASSGVAAPCGCIDALQLTPAEMGAAVQEAHRSRLHVLAHAIPNASVLEALAAGVDSIEHGVFLDQHAVDAMKAAGVHYCPTLAVFARISVNAAPGRYPPHMVEKAGLCVAAHEASFRLAVKAGIPILAGSDAGNWGWQLGDLVDELILMERYGLPSVDCIAAATSDAARFLGKGDEIGAIRSGLAGDMLLVEGNPVEDLAALRRVRCVFKQGVLVHDNAKPAEAASSRDFSGP